MENMVHVGIAAVESSDVSARTTIAIPYSDLIQCLQVQVLQSIPCCRGVEANVSGREILIHCTSFRRSLQYFHNPLVDPDRCLRQFTQDFPL